MSEKLSFLDAVQNRRSIYGLKKSSKISDDRIQEIVKTALNNVPSSFNSQSTRLVVLLKQDHDWFWDTVTDVLKAIVPAEQWEHTGGRLKMFKEGYGTVLFYEDPEPVKALQAKLPQYAEKFPQWSEHTSAMHQYVLWTAFEAEGLGANLQHYNPLADQKVADKYSIPLEWAQKAQLVFGDPVDEKRENTQAKASEPIEKKLKVFGA